MSYRGYLKDSGGSKRLRFVMPGYDADDENTPSNKVIFDTNSDAVLNIYAQGQWTGTVPSSGTYIASWPNIGYAPFVAMQFLYGDEWMPYFMYYRSSPFVAPRFTAYSDGLHLQNSYGNSNSSPIVYTLRYQVYRLRVQ